jgi:plastocyanin
MTKMLIAVAATGALTAGVVAGPSLGAASRTVQVKDNVFAPTSITVRRGTTVRWVWKGKAPHNVTVTKGPLMFHSKTQMKGSFSKRLTRKGTYSILCTIHAPGMKMTVKVK